MADFSRALARTLAYEGGWVHDPNDAGGETWYGVTRRDHPSWPGWQTIDRLRQEQAESFPACLNRMPELQAQLASLYRARYWDAIRGYDITEQAVADELFDSAVNLGVINAGLLLQRSLNCLNADETRYADVAEDGNVGPQTLTALALCVRQGDATLLVKLMNHLQGARYADLMRHNKRLERFARGWLRRT